MSDTKGYIYLWRKLLDSKIWKLDGELLKVFIWCLLKATHKPLESNGVIVDKGQFFVGEKVASIELGIPSSTYRGKLRRLKDLGIVATKVVNRFTLVSVCKYATYQNKDMKDTEQPANTATIYKDNNNNNKDTYVSTEKPVGKTKSKAKPREETRPVLDYFRNKYKEKFGEPYNVSWGKDSASIKRLLDGGFTATKLFELIVMFLNDPNEYLLTHGYSISLFAHNINTYVVKSTTETKIPSEPFDTRHVPESEAKQEEKQREFLLDKFEKKFGGKENIPDDWWRTLYPDDAKNPNRK